MWSVANMNKAFAFPPTPTCACPSEPSTDAEQIEKEKDPEVKAEVKKGNIVTIIEDSMDY